MTGRTSLLTPAQHRRMAKIYLQPDERETPPRGETGRRNSGAARGAGENDRTASGFSRDTNISPRPVDIVLSIKSYRCELRSECDVCPVGN